HPFRTRPISTSTPSDQATQAFRSKTRHVGITKLIGLSAKAVRKALPFRARVEGPERTGDGKVNNGKGKTSQ
ncbi:hypothetical protein, partial [Paraburkholderia aspalathi]